MKFVYEQDGVTKETEVVPVEYSPDSTMVHVDIRLKKDDILYHLLGWEIFLCGGEEKHIEYDRLTFWVEQIELSYREIFDVLVSYLGELKLYLHDFKIVSDGGMVGYGRGEGAKKFFEMEFEPKTRHRDIYLEANVQVEDGVDYEKFLDIRIKEPISEIPEEKLVELGYDTGREYISGYIILSEEEMKKVHF